MIYFQVNKIYMLNYITLIISEYKHDSKNVDNIQ